MSDILAQIESALRSDSDARRDEALDAAHVEITKLRAFAKELSNALIKARPLGGSELFVQRFGGFYADPAYCGQLIEKQQREGIELRLELARMRNASSRLSSEEL